MFTKWIERLMVPWAGWYPAGAIPSHPWGSSRDHVDAAIKGLKDDESVTLDVGRVRAVLNLLRTTEFQRKSAQTTLDQATKRLADATTTPTQSLVDMVELFLTSGCSRDQLIEAWKRANEQIRPGKWRD